LAGSKPVGCFKKLKLIHENYSHSFFLLKLSAFYPQFCGGKAWAIVYVKSTSSHTPAKAKPADKLPIISHFLMGLIIARGCQDGRLTIFQFVSDNLVNPR